MRQSVTIEMDNRPHPSKNSTNELYHFPNQNIDLKNKVELIVRMATANEAVLTSGDGNAGADRYSFYLSFPANLIQLNQFQLENFSFNIYDQRGGENGRTIPYDLYLEETESDIRFYVLFRKACAIGRSMERYQSQNDTRWGFKATLPGFLLSPNIQERFQIMIVANCENEESPTLNGNTAVVTCVPFPEPEKIKGEIQLRSKNYVAGKNVDDTLYHFTDNLKLENRLTLSLSQRNFNYQARTLKSGAGQAGFNQCSFYLSLPANTIQLADIELNDIRLGFSSDGSFTNYGIADGVFSLHIGETGGELRICVLFKEPVKIGMENRYTNGEWAFVSYNMSLQIGRVLLVSKAPSQFTFSGIFYVTTTDIEDAYGVSSHIPVISSESVNCIDFPKPVPTVNEDLALHFQNTSGNTSDVLFIQDDTEDGDNIELIVGTEEGTPAISLFSESVTASRESFSFSFKFTPSSIEKEMKVMDIYTYVNDEWRKALEGEWSIESVINDDKSLVIYCLSRQSVSFNRPHSVKLVMRGVKPVVRKSSSPKVELYLRDSNYLNEYFCSQPFNIVSHAGDRYMPIKVAVDGWQLLNNGTANRVVLALVNDHNESIVFKKSTIEVSWDISETESFALSKDSVTADSVRIFDKPVELPGIAETGTARYLLKGYSGRINPGDSLPITIANLKTNLPAGTAKIYIRYYDVPEYWDGVLEAPLLRTSVFQADQEHIGIGTNNPKTKLHIADGDLLVGGAPNRLEGIRLTSLKEREQGGGRIFFQENANGLDGFSLGYNGVNTDGDILNWPAKSFNISNHHESENGGICLNIDRDTGNVGIGIVSGDNKLTVAGSVSIGRHDEPTAVPENSLWVEGQVGIGIIRTKVKLAIGVPEENTGLYIERGDYETHLPYVNGWNYISGKGLVVRGEGGLHNIEVDGSTGNVGIENDLSVNGSINIGVGTSDPQIKLHVAEGDLLVGGAPGKLEGIRLMSLKQSEQGGGRLFFQENANGLYGFSLGYNGANTTGAILNWPPNSFNISNHYNSENGGICLNIDRSTGNVGIGKNSDNSNKLSVKGTVQATTLKIGDTELNETQLKNLVKFLAGTLEVRIKSNVAGRKYMYASGSQPQTNCYEVRYNRDGNNEEDDPEFVWRIEPK
ncbi:hypothetical protein [Lewinella cohaerens]|uniref:hypothetical protein n=1 Tax=Lewinella cohaerens TaxID=70995 RepID=UPI0003756AB9|nr:hypothetical protein [Lewinella cohaerens]